MKKFLIGVGISLLVIVLVVVGYVWSKLDLIQFEGEILQVQQSEGEIQEPEGAIVDISGLDISETLPVISDKDVEQDESITNILLIGTDERSKSFSTNARSDSMILVSIDKNNNTVKLVSLERGMGVPVLEGEYEGQYDWLTHIFRYGGADLLMKTVEHCFRVEVEHYVRVNFTTVTEVVDAIGGIDIELSGDEAWYLNQHCKSVLNFQQTYLKEGTNHINGEVALGLARLRAIDSDWQRVERQRRVVAACADALKDSSIGDLNHLLDQVLPLIQTNLTMLEITEWILYAPNLLSAAFDQMTIPEEGTYGGMTGMGGRVLYAVDFETNSQILKEFLYGETE